MTKKDENKKDENKKDENKNGKRKNEEIPSPPIKKPRHIPIFFEIIEINKNRNLCGDNGGGCDENNPVEVYSSEEEVFSDEELETLYLDEKLENIEDFIRIGKNYFDGKYDNGFKKYNINVKTVSKLVEPLEKLNRMIGMNEIKKDVFELLLYQLQEFDKSKDMLHTIIDGEPGVGKTELAKILAQIYHKMGYCKNKKVKFVKRSDLIGGYLGQTAIKTQKVLNDCKGGVLVIDEAYSLGNKEGRDSYAKECIDTLTAFLSESPETIVFMMGYKESLEECLFAHNKGLERRFTYRFSIHKYKPEELKLILFKIIEGEGWNIENKEEIPDTFFIENEKYFPFNGGDMLNLFTKCKFTHSLRYFNLCKKATQEKNYENLKKSINFEDIQNAFKLLLKDENFERRNVEEDTTYKYSLYT
jgi:DNA replication protein DnaC